ncbi:hypothetical protein ACNFBR_10480 [Pseudomonas sp. NY11955]|uniref:hypothetical protein n=1 Tax=Pseudomonas sp. NY11955 TaxID=3400363 RepID=UPI003A84997D
MEKKDIAILTAVVVGSFFSGVVWAPIFTDKALIKDLLESSSYVATIFACVVAVVALSSWKKQFRFSERFSRLSSLKDAATDLHLYRGYLQDISRAIELKLGGEDVPDNFAKDLESKREKVLDTFSFYKKSWTSAVAFLSAQEEAEIQGRPDVFISMYMRYPQQLYSAAEVCFLTGDRAEYDSIKQEAIERAKSLYAQTVGALDHLLSQKI